MQYISGIIQKFIRSLVY